jgi:hypothetical protein
MDKLPIYRLEISEDLDAPQEVSAVALVDMPAIEQPFFAFDKVQRFAIASEDERIVVGPAMIPDMPIYRRDEAGEYYVVFDKKTIEKIALKFYAKGLQDQANEMHSKPVEGVVFFQSWIADESKGIPKMKQFEDLPDGTWFLGAKVENDETWAKVKDGTFKGFSVEGYFDMKPVQLQASRTPEQIIEAIFQLVKDI